MRWDLESVNPFYTARIWGAVALCLAVLLFFGVGWLGAKQVAYNRALRLLILERCR